MADYVMNILSVYLRASETEYQEGMSWYADRNVFARTLTPDDVWKGAGIIAAFSPLTPWSRNIELATKFVASNGTMTTGTLSNSLRAAFRIYNGEHTLDVLKGDKTRAFASAIADPSHNVATIDRHAHDIAMGYVHDNATRVIGKRIFRDMSNAYSEAAELAGTAPAQMQAITWLAHRRITNVWQRKYDA